jgi:hypothetical protein
MSHLNINKQFYKMSHAYCILIGGKHLNRQPGLLLPIFDGFNWERKTQKRYCYDGSGDLDLCLGNGK